MPAESAVDTFRVCDLANGLETKRLPKVSDPVLRVRMEKIIAVLRFGDREGREIIRIRDLPSNVSTIEMVELLENFLGIEWVDDPAQPDPGLWHHITGRYEARNRFPSGIFTERKTPLIPPHTNMGIRSRHT